MSAILTAYYSFTKRTQDLAETIALLTDSDILEIVPRKEYSFAHNTASKEVRSEISRGFCPELVSGSGVINQYDKIFVGTPNWFRSVSPPLLSFLRKHDFAGKTIIPFCTHGGGGFGEIEAVIAQECPGSNLLSGIAVGDEYSQEQILEWLKNLNIIDILETEN